MRMQADPTATFSTLGYNLVDKIALPEQTLNLLFAALIMTVLGAFIGGNLLLLNAEVIWRSALITLPCLGLVLLFYALSRHLGNLVWGLVLTYAALCGLVYARLPGSNYILYACFALAALYAIRFMRLERRHWWLVLLMAVVGTATVLGVARAYTSFDMLSRLHLGNVHQDTLYHASISAMIKHYGVTSTGLHGLVETPYHALSHVLMAGISLLSGSGVIEVYGVANWVLFAPLLLFSIAACCAMLDRAGQLSMPMVWAVSALLLCALPLLFGRWGVKGSFFVSESYLVSLAIFLLSLGLLFKRSLTLLDLVLIGLAAALIANAKASVGLIYGGLWLVRFIFVRSDSRLMDLAAFLLSVGAVGLAVIEAAESRSGLISFSPLSYVRSYSLWGGHLGTAVSAVRGGEIPSLKSLAMGMAALISYVTLHFLVSWIVVWQIVYRRGLGELLSTPIAVYSLAAVAAGLLISSTFAIPGGSAYYFSNVAFFVSLPAVVSMLTLGWLRRVPDQRLWLGLVVIFVSLVSWPSYYRNSGLSPSHATRVENLLIDHLLIIRKTSPLNLVLRPNDDLLANNPVKRCTAQPFVYPAVAERPWIDVIQGAESACSYSNYGYSKYGISAEDRYVKMAPRLLSGMSVQQE